MKTIITFTFLLFSFLGFSQTTREEVVERNKEGQKRIVNTYSGTGNGEKLIKRTFYQDENGNSKLHRSRIGSPISLKPIFIDYYGKYKEILTYKVVSMDHIKTYKVGDSYEYQSYGIVKTETFYGDGTLKETWKIEDEKVIDGFNGYGVVDIHYVLIP